MLLMQGCMTDTNTLEVTGAGAEQAERDFKAEFDRPNVASVRVVNNQLVIQGSRFHHVDKIQIKGYGDNAFLDEFTIESKGQNQIIANSIRNIDYLVGAAFDLILSNAYGSATYNVTFTIPDGGVTGKKINRMDAQDGEVLAWNSTDEEWEPIALSSINLKGAWDPEANNDPEIVSGGYASVSPPSHGDFYVTTKAYDRSGDTPDNIDTVQVWGAGDWIFWDSSKNAGSGAWIRIQNTQQVTRVNTKSGDVTLGWDDIPKTGSSVDDIVDVDTSTTAPTSGQVLKWNGTKWVPQDDDTQTFTGVIETTAIQNGTILNEDISDSAAIAVSKIDGLQTALDGKLSLATGGTVSGDIDMNGNSISNVNLVDGESIDQLRADINSNSSTISSAFNATATSYVRGNGSNAPLSTDVVPEDGSPTNLWFTEARVRDTILTGYTSGADAAVNSTDSVVDAIGKLQAQVTTAKADAAGGGDFKKDGTVNMTGDFNGGNNNITNVANITASGVVDSTSMLIASGLFGSNVAVPTFQFEIENAAVGLTTKAGTITTTKDSVTVTGSGTDFTNDFTNNSYIYIHGVPYQVSSRESATSLTLSSAVPFSAQDISYQSGKTGLAFLDSNRAGSIAMDLEKGDIRLGGHAATDSDSSRIEAYTIGRTENDGTYNTTMLTLDSRNYVEATNANSGEQAIMRLSALRNSFTDGTPKDSGTLASQLGVELTYGHEIADSGATPTTTTVKGMELNSKLRSGTLTNFYDIHVTEPTGSNTPTNYHGIVVEGTGKKNIIEGTLEVGGEGLTAAQGGKLLVNGNLELLNGGVFYGDGSGLTGISASGATSADDNPIVGDSDNDGTGDIKFKIGTNGGGDADVVAVIDNDGQMGLGVLAPTHKLEVEGNTLLDATSADGVFFNVSSGASDFGIREVGTSAIVNIGDPDDFEKGINFGVAAGGVSIGARSTSGKFEVSDVILNDDDNCANNPGYTNGDFDGDSTSDDCKKIGIAVDSSANVGIGTDSPSVELEINGEILADNYKAFYEERTLGGSLNDTVEIGSFTGTGSNILDIGIKMGLVIKRYQINLNDNDSGEKIIRPILTDRSTDTDDYDLLGTYSGSSLLLELRRSSAGSDETAYVHIKSYTNNTFTSTSTTNFSSTTTYHNGSPLRSFNDFSSAGPTNAMTETFAVGVGTTYNSANFALTESSGTALEAFEFRLHNNDLKFGYVSDISSGSAPINEFIFTDDGILTAPFFSGDGASLTNVTAATVTDPGTNISFTVDNDNGSPDNTADFSFKNGSTATEVVTIDGVGNIGINTSDINVETYSNDSASANDRRMVISGSGGRGSLVLNNTVVPNATTGMTAYAQAEAGSIEFLVSGNEGSTETSGGSDIDDDIDPGDSIAYIKANLSGNGSIDSSSYSDGYGGELTFWTKVDTDGTATGGTNVVKRMAIDNAGNVDIISGDLEFAGTAICSAAGCTSTSDARLKKDVEPLKDSLKKVLALSGVSYDWIDIEKYGDKHQIGFIAQELELLFPEVVYTDKDSGLKTVSYGQLVAPVIEAIKEHNQMIENNQAMYQTMQGRLEKVEREIASLKEENAELKARVEKLESLVEQLLNK